jgi:hypothetical protein
MEHGRGKVRFGQHCSGSAPAPGAVFRALAENLVRAGTVRVFVSISHALLRNAKRVPPHPRAGVLPLNRVYPWLNSAFNSPCQSYAARQSNTFNCTVVRPL